MKVWSEVSPGMIAFSRARVRVCHGVCAQAFHGERGREILTRRRRRRPAAAAVTPAGRGWGSATADASTDSPPCHEGVHARTRPPSLHKIFFAHHCPCIHTLPRRLWPSHALASTPIAALPCTRFHARDSAVAALAFIRFHAHRGPPIHKLARP